VQSWHKEDNLYLRQRRNACFYLQQGDYLRAAALGYEAFITCRVQQNKTAPKLDPQNYEHRQQIKESLKKNNDYKLLSNLRNSLAHGTRSDMADVQRALSSKDNLHAELNRLFNSLLPKESK
jgi:hypothetical protein